MIIQKFCYNLLVKLVIRITHNNIKLNDFHSLCYFIMDLKNMYLIVRMVIV